MMLMVIKYMKWKGLNLCTSDVYRLDCVFAVLLKQNITQFLTVAKFYWTFEFNLQQDISYLSTVYIDFTQSIKLGNIALKHAT